MRSLGSSKHEAAVFVDRDGVICENRSDHVRTWSEFIFLPGAIDALAALTRAGLRLFVVTNQAAVGRGLMSRRTLDEIHERMLAALAEGGVRVESVLVCPHHPDDGCPCRKPEPGLLVEAAARFGIDLGASFMVGDARSDIEAGSRAGCETVLVKTGRGAEAVRETAGEPTPGFLADDLVDAAIRILARRAERTGELPSRPRVVGSADRRR